MESSLLTLYTIRKFKHEIIYKQQSYASREGLISAATGINNAIRQIINEDKYGYFQSLEAIFQSLDAYEIPLKDISSTKKDIKQIFSGIDHLVVPQIVVRYNELCAGYFERVYNQEIKRFGHGSGFGIDNYEQIYKGFLQWTTHFWTEYYNEIEAAIIANIESEEYLTELGKVQKRPSQHFVPFSAFVGPTKAENYSNVIADAGAAIGRSIGSSGAYHSAGATRIRIVAVIDNRTTEMCRMMHGTIFDTSQVIHTYATAAEKPTADGWLADNSWISYNKSMGVHVRHGYGNNLTRTKITRDMTSFELSGLGINLPPYHGRCRTVTELDYTDTGYAIGGGGARPTDTQSRKPLPKANEAIPPTRTGRPDVLVRPPAKVPVQVSPKGNKDVAQNAVVTPGKPPVKTPKVKAPKAVKEEKPPVSWVDDPKSVVLVNKKTNIVMIKDKGDVTLGEIVDVLMKHDFRDAETVTIHYSGKQIIFERDFNVTWEMFRERVKDFDIATIKDNFLLGGDIRQLRFVAEQKKGKNILNIRGTTETPEMVASIERKINFTEKSVDMTYFATTNTGRGMLKQWLGQVEFFKKIGLEKLDVHTSWIGGYTWPRVGYKLIDEGVYTARSFGEVYYRLVNQQIQKAFDIEAMPLELKESLRVLGSRIKEKSIEPHEISMLEIDSKYIRDFAPIAESLKNRNNFGTGEGFKVEDVISKDGKKFLLGKYLLLDSQWTMLMDLTNEGLKVAREYINK